MRSINDECSSFRIGRKSLTDPEVFAGCLLVYRKRVTEKLANLIEDESQILWVVTVPAIWSLGAKHIIRQAAKLAGLWTDKNPKQLRIALEPECGCLYVMHEYRKQGKFQFLERCVSIS